jgi:hypothetical protein
MERSSVLPPREEMIDWLGDYTTIALGFKAMLMQAGAKARGHNLLTLMRQRDRRGSLLPFGHQPARFKLAAQHVDTAT